jgi:hypothetical protein
MLTPAQQKIRQELEELQVRSLSLKNKNNISPIETRPRKKRVYVSLLLFILACSFLATAFYTEQRHDNIESYLTRVQAYDQQSDKLLQNFIVDSASEYTMLEAKLKQKKLLQKTNALKPQPTLKTINKISLL